MTANEDLEKIREAITGRAGPASHPGGAGAGGPGAGERFGGNGKKKRGPAPLPADPAPAPPPPVPRGRSGGGGGGSVLGWIAFLVVAAIVITGWAGGDLPGFGFHAPSWSAGSSPGSGSGSGYGTAPDYGTTPDDSSYAAPKELSVSPQSGSMWTTVTVTGSGFIRDGVVKLTFHASAMGEADTDGDGAFTARMRLPDPGFYSHFPGQTFSISTTEYTRDGIYQGNGPAVGFHVD